MIITKIFAIVLLANFNLLSQNTDPTTKKAIVLINGEAYLVDVTPKGLITATYQKISNYFTTSESHQNMLVRLSGGQLNETGDKIVFYEKESEPLPSFQSENQQSLTAEAQRFIGFSPGKAVLNKGAVDYIREIAQGYKNGQITLVKINALYINSYRSRSLARNRAHAIRGLLGAFGVPMNIIISDTLLAGAESKLDFVQISFD